MNINVLHFATLHNTIIYKCIQTLTSSRKEKKTESKLDKVKNLHKLKENLSKEEEKKEQYQNMYSGVKNANNFVN